MKNNYFTKLLFLLFGALVLFSCASGEIAAKNDTETEITGDVVSRGRIAPSPGNEIAFSGEVRSGLMIAMPEEVWVDNSDAVWVDFNTSEFDHITDNPFLRPRENPLSTFSIDVDTAGYSIVRNFINRGSLPPQSSVRIEELINYFDYAYPPPVRCWPRQAAIKKKQSLMR